MKDLASLKKEIARLADVDTLKKELNRLAGEIKGFDVHVALSPKAKSRLNKVEKRFSQLVKRLAKLQKEVDASLVKFVKLVRRSTGTATKTARKSTRATQKKTARRTSTTRKA